LEKESAKTKRARARKSLTKIRELLKEFSWLLVLILQVVWNQRNKIIIGLIIFCMIFATQVLPHGVIIPQSTSTSIFTAVGRADVYCITLIGRPVTIQVAPSIINGSSREFLCLIENPAPFAWNITQINPQSIRLNDTVHPLIVDTCYYENGTTFLEASFSTGSLVSLLGNQTLKTEIVTLYINGTTEYGWFWGQTEALLNYTL
jgi:hypothetical protein